MENTDQIIVRGARQHNLKNINVAIPRNKFVVITGVSGSGKSSLAFDTIFAEGQRRYIESLSAYARQFLGQLDKPDVDSIDGLSPAISIDQKASSHNPRSTVGTVTEIYDFLRLLYARVGTAHCPQCDRLINPQTIDQIVDQVLALPTGSKIQIMAPLISGRKGEYQALLQDLRQQGFARVRIDGEVLAIDEEITIDKNKKHTIELVVDRLIIKSGIQSRLADSIALAAKCGHGSVLVDILPDAEEKNSLSETKREMLFSEHYACVYCNISFAEITPRIFSFNSPYGACPDCHGLGSTAEVDTTLVVPDDKKTLKEGAIYPWTKSGNPYYMQLLNSLAKHYKFSMEIPFAKLTKAHRDAILYGSGEEKIKLKYESFDGEGFTEYRKPFEGVIPNLKRRYEESSSEKQRQDLENYMTQMACQNCQGSRLKPESLAVRIAGLSIAHLCNLSVTKAEAFFAALPAKFSDRQKTIAHQVLIEISARLKFLSDVGLNYLTLDRKASTLSGGEAQRIRLATSNRFRIIRRALCTGRTFRRITST